MFEGKTNHICSIAEENSRSYLPILTPIDPLWERIKRFVKKYILITEINPQAGEFFRNTSRIIDERKIQVASGSWVIHPFSTFRLYYEIYMTVVYFISIIVFPIDATYGILKEARRVKNVLIVTTYIDVVFNFLTGYVVSQEKIIMRRSEVARHYVFGIYFITDILSSLPVVCTARYHNIYCDASTVLGLLRISRLNTFLAYLGHSLTYFRFHGFQSLFIKILSLTLLLTSYLGCFFYISTLIHISLREQTVIVNNSRFQKDIHAYDSDIEYIWGTYLVYLYTASSLLLCIDMKFYYSDPWLTYVLYMVSFFVGKILVVFATVLLVDILKNPYLLEVKYHAMMSQIDSFLETHHCPIALQTKIRTFYHYKYRERYLNEPRIEKLLSEKLKKEIKYHDCLKLIQNVQFFEHFSVRILEDILTELKKEIYMSNDYIIKSGTHGNCMYFMASGTVVVLSPAGKEICHLQDGDYFGEISLLVPKAKRCATVMALEISEVYKMEKKTFKKYIPTDTELFKQINTEAKRRYLETKEIESTISDLRRT